MSPEKYGIVPRTTTLSANVRANLIIVSKVLQVCFLQRFAYANTNQKLSNEVYFEDHSEAYAKCMNGFLDRNKERCINYFRNVINDPLATQCAYLLSLRVLLLMNVISKERLE